MLFLGHGSSQGGCGGGVRNKAKTIELVLSSKQADKDGKGLVGDTALEDHPCRVRKERLVYALTGGSDARRTAGRRSRKRETKKGEPYGYSKRRRENCAIRGKVTTGDSLRAGIQEEGGQGNQTNREQFALLASGGKKKQEG